MARKIHWRTASYVAAAVLLTLVVQSAMAGVGYTRSANMGATRLKVAQGYDFDDGSTFATGEKEIVSTTVRVPAGTTQRLVISFSGASVCKSGPGGWRCVVRASVDGALGEQRIVDTDISSDSAFDDFEPYMVQWVTSTLDPGQHTVTIYGGTDEPAGTTRFYPGSNWTLVLEMWRVS